MIKLTKKQQQNYQWLVILALLCLVGYVFMIFPIRAPLSFFKHSNFLGVALSVFCIGIAWHVVSGKSQKFPITIVESIPRPQRVHTTSAKTRFGFINVFPVITYGMSLGLVVNMLILVVVAFNSGTGKVIVDFNHFGEMHVEIVLFSIVTILCFLGLIVLFRNMKKALRK